MVSSTRLEGAEDAAHESLPPSLVGLDGREVPALLGAAPGDVRAFVASGRRRVPVPVQVDERFPQPPGGSQPPTVFAYEAGAEPRRDPDAAFDADDLLLLPADAAGDRLPRADRSGLVEVEVQAAGRVAWLYIHADPSAPLPDPRVRYDARRDAVSGVAYRLASRPDRLAVLDELRLGDPEQAPNILDRSKARLELGLALGIGTVRRTEDDVAARTTGLHVGPLRIIREVEVRGRMLFGFYTRPVRDRFEYYGDGFSVPTTVWVARRYATLIRRISLRITMDLNDAARGMSFQSAPEIPRPLPIDGRQGQRGGERPLRWYLLRNAHVGLLGWLTADPRVLPDVSLYYVDDLDHPDPPEEARGQIGDHGFLYQRSADLPTGALRLTTHAWIVAGSDLSDPEAARRRFDERPTVRVSSETMAQR
jgi:hypothetical protein